jgi:hypothetical protein
MAWYAEGHVFSEGERRAALAAYASKLGVPLKGADAKVVKTVSACSASRPAMTKPASLRVPNVPHPLPRPIQASFEQLAPPPAVAQSVEPVGVVVHVPQLHVIDQPKPVITSFSGGQSGAASVPAPAAALAAVPPVSAAPAPLPAVGHTPATPVAPPLAPIAASAAQTLQATAYAQDASDPGASACLSVASDGSHWGFKNSCQYSVQFVYCLKGDSEVLASCKDGAISGSAAPASFSALVADASMKESNVDHQFRWVACGGGAGEVIPKLDGVDPPIGRCLRARTAAR